MSQNALATGAGKPEADVIAAAKAWANSAPIDCREVVQALKAAIERMKEAEKGGA